MVFIYFVLFTQAMNLIVNFRHSTSSSKLVLPMKDNELASRQEDTTYVHEWLDISYAFPIRLDEGKTTALRTYSQTQVAFEDTSAFSEVKRHLSVRFL